MLRVLLHKLNSFRHSSFFVQLWLLPAWLMLGFSRLIVLLLPFRYLAPWLGRHDGVCPWVPIANLQEEARALQIGRVVRMASAYTPWNSNCFPQAITASCLLRLYRVPYVLFFGVAHDEKASKMQAHAWIATGPVSVTGGMSFGEFTVVGCFVGRV